MKTLLAILLTLSSISSSKWKNECSYQLIPLTLYHDEESVLVFSSTIINAWVIKEPTTGPWLVIYYPNGNTFQIWPPEDGHYELIAWKRVETGDICGVISWDWPIGE